MKCPLFFTAYIPTLDAVSYAKTDCLKEKCALWNSEVEACAIISLNLELATISETLGEIAHKMPHEGQFRK